MAKNGFSISNRQAVETIGSAGKQLTADDCGKVFKIESSSAAIISVPSLGAAESGWNCVFIIGEGTQGNHEINGFSEAGSVVGLTSDVNAVSNLPAKSAGDLETITFAGSNTNDGDRVEVVTDGEHWYVKTFVAAINAYST